MDPYLYEQVQDALRILNDMEDTFESWFPQHIDFLPEEEQEHFTPDEMREEKEQFSRTKLNLELGIYTSEDYDYLQWIVDRVLDHDQYFDAVNTLIYALSLEYGPI